ncbi:MAG TPA: tyrosine--tRNA ligase [Dehalococcoidia bacterium]|nr:tyrosine--tRNA ligase [Dehalococcoidia bacterium]
MDKALEYVLKRGVAEIIVEEEMVRLLESGKKLKLKMGFDPSRPDIHLGHVVGMRKLRQFQDLGHQVVLIVGDWTAQIGDPSGESQTRPMLSAEEVRANAETYKKQFFKVVDREKTELRWQSEWFGKFTLADVIELTSKFTVAQLLAREDFSNRHASGRPIAITELLYPLLQAYDSIAIEADVEFGGIDQKFNCLMGRELQKMVGQPPQQVFLMPLLVGTDGQQKMSKSLDNYIAIDEPAYYTDRLTGERKGMYGSVMSIPDSLIMDYFELLTDVDDQMLNEYRKMLSDNSKNPMEIKKFLAWEIVRQFHSTEAADEAQKYFEKDVQWKEVPEDIVEHMISFQALGELQKEILIRKGKLSAETAGEVSCEDMGTLAWTVPIIGTANVKYIKPSIGEFLHLSGLVQSRAEAKRMVNQKAVELDGVRIVSFDETRPINDGSIIRIGKRKWKRIVNKDAK